MKKKASNSSGSRYQLTTVGKLRAAGRTAASRPTITLDPARVPHALRQLIPLAEQWGITDDIIRDDVFRQASASDIRRLRKILRENDGELDKWLAGPEASSRSPSSEYIAFSAMRMGVDML
jgi:hypothetical protein